MATAASAGTSNTTQALWDTLNQRSETKKTDAVSGAQDRFLKLLTTQLRNQDPLNPLDNAQMTSQLAQISTVDGIERLNATLQKMLTGTTDAQAVQAATLVGRGVLVPGSDMGLFEGKGYGGFELAEPADEVTVTIKNANGMVMRTMTLDAADAGVHMFNWDGKIDNGSPAVDGQYQFSVSATRGKDEVRVGALSAGIVSSVLRSGTGISLNVGTMGAFSMNDVRQVM